MENSSNKSRFIYFDKYWKTFNKYKKINPVFNWILVWAEVLTFGVTFSTWTIHYRAEVGKVGFPNRAERRRREASRQKCLGPDDPQALRRS